MTFHDYVDLAMLICVIIPAWGAAFKFFFLHREYPLHLHDESDGLRIKFPKGYEPSAYRKER